ncbi:ParA family protein [Fusobacterium sp. SYSU M8D902]|uniref:ParA family protein n=1 Tax=Fusobacterium sp. SYSU M8D902 TaxID=3159562 RepID=UPI0032E4EBF0
MKKIKVTLGKTKRNDKLILATAGISISKFFREAIKFNKDDNNLNLIYKNKKLEIRNGYVPKELFIQGNDVEIIKNVSLYKTGTTYKLSIPLSIINDMGITENNRDVTISIKTDDRENYLEIVKRENYLEEKMTDSKVITIKVNKGGIGKTFVTTQLGYRLAEFGKKVLMLTSDSQNNIYAYLTAYNKNMEKPLEIKEGLKHWVSKGNGELIKLRNNLYFIPLENSIFGTQFFMNLPSFINKMKEEYDYILIDSIPTMKIDTEFVKCSDKVIIPCFCDWVTVDGVIKVVEEAGAEKILSIIVNKYENKSTQKVYLDKLKKALDKTGILLPNPIKNSSKIEKLLDKGKSIYESEDNSLKEIKESFDDVIEKILYAENELDNELDFDI